MAQRLRDHPARVVRVAPGRATQPRRRVTAASFFGQRPGRRTPVRSREPRSDTRQPPELARARHRTSPRLARPTPGHRCQPVDSQDPRSTQWQRGISASAPRPMFLRRVRRTGRVRRHVQRTRPLVGRSCPGPGHPRSRSLGPASGARGESAGKYVTDCKWNRGLQTASPATTCPRRRLEPAACPARKSSTSPTPCPWRSHGHAVASRPQSPGLFDPVRSPVRANVQPASPRRAGVRMPSPLPTSAYVAPQAGPHNPLPVVYS